MSQLRTGALKHEAYTQSLNNSVDTCISWDKLDLSEPVKVIELRYLIT